MPTPHKHAEFIKAWADGQEVQVMTSGGWDGVALSPSWLDSNQYRIKPAAPKWPQTTMTPEAMSALHHNDPTHCDLRKFANGVIEHECETGELVPADKVREIEAKAGELGMDEGSKRNADRDLEVARAVDKWYRDTLPFKIQNSDYYLLDIVRSMPK